MTDRSVDIRFLQHTAGLYVRNVYDALAELITNSDDAYSRIGAQSGEIVIEHYGKYGRQRGPAMIVVRDKATGMTGARMKKIAVFGRETSGETDRGFFGSGLKNCQSIADILIESVVDSIYHHGKMSFTLDKNVEVQDAHRVASAAIRKRLGLTSKDDNGTSITLILKDTVSLPRLTSMQKDLPHLYALRKICEANSDRKVYLQSGKDGRRHPINYHRPKGSLVYEEEFKVDGHICRFKLFRSDEPLEQVPDPVVGRSGIIIHSGKACHELTHFTSSNKNNPFATHYFGELRCDHISTLLRAFNEGKPTKDNPVLVVEPTREGLNRDHPFVKKLLEHPAEVLAGFLDEDIKKARQDENSIISVKTRALFTKMARYMGEIFDEQTDEDDELYPGGRKGEETIQNKGILVIPDHVKVALDMHRTVTVYALKNSVKDTDKLIVTADNNVATIKRPKALKPHSKHDDRFLCNFTVEPKAVTDFSTIDIQLGNLKEEIILEVVKKFEREFNHPLEFGRKREFTEGEHELRLYAHEDIMRGHEQLQFKVTMLEGSGIDFLGKVNTRVLNMQAGANYATGAVRIRCKGIGSEAHVEAQLGTYKAKTHLKVVNPKIIARSPYNIEFVEQEGMRFRWHNDYMLHISALHPSIRHLLGKAPKYAGQDTPAARMAIVNILIDAIVKKTIQRKASMGHVYGFSGKTDENIIENISAEQEREILKIAGKVFTKVWS
jgi:hypothetical protein